MVGTQVSRPRISHLRPHDFIPLRPLVYGGLRESIVKNAPTSIKPLCLWAPEAGARHTPILTWLLPLRVCSQRSCYEIFLIRRARLALFLAMCLYSTYQYSKDIRPSLPIMASEYFNCRVPSSWVLSTAPWDIYISSLVSYLVVGSVCRVTHGAIVCYYVKLIYALGRWESFLGDTHLLFL